MQNDLIAQTVLLRDNTLLFVGACLVAAVLIAQGVQRLFRLPTITGYLLTGMVLGPFGLKAFDAEMLQEVSLFSDIGIGLLLFELGRRLDMHWLWRERTLLATSLMECGLTFAAVYALMVFGGFGTVPAALLGTIAMTSSPVILLPIIQETRAEGQVSDRAAVMAAGDNGLALVLAALMLSVTHVLNESGWKPTLMEPLRELLGALALGSIAGLFCCGLVRALRRMARFESALRLLAFGVILVTIGLAKALDVPPLLALLTMGFTCKNFDSGHAMLGLSLDPLTGLFVCVLFVQMGAGLNLMAWQGVATWVLVFLLVRSAVKLVVPMLAARLDGLSWRQGFSLGVALQPMANLSVLMVQSTSLSYPELGAKATAIAIAALAVLELAGPLATRWALSHAGETAR